MQKPNGFPIVIGGCHRSGTSLARRILNAHSKIYCGPEVKFFRDWHGDYPYDPLHHGRFIQSARSMLPEEELFALLGQAFLAIHERAAQLANKPRWADKSPENVLHLAQWEKLLGENWLFVHVVRNPLDTLASIREAKFTNTIPSHLDQQIEFYKRYTLAGLEYSRANPARSYRLVYERLVRSPEKEIARLMEWLGEEAEAVQVNFNDTPHQPGLEDPKIAQTKHVHAGSIGRWKRDLTGAQIAAILNATASLWREVGEGENF